MLIAFDGSFPAARALQRFAHLSFAKDFKIRIVTSHTNPVVGHYYLKHAKSYLNDYGVHDVETDYIDGSIIDRVMIDNDQWADLIVLGGHSKNMLKDFFIGSLTKNLIKDAGKPLFIGF